MSRDSFGNWSAASSTARCCTAPAQLGRHPREVNIGKPFERSGYFFSPASLRNGRQPRWTSHSVRASLAPTTSVRNNASSAVSAASRTASASFSNARSWVVAYAARCRRTARGYGARGLTPAGFPLWLSHCRAAILRRDTASAPGRSPAPPPAPAPRWPSPPPPAPSAR